MLHVASVIKSSATDGLTFAENHKKTAEAEGRMVTV